MPKTLIAGNWKLQKTQAEAKEFLAEFLPALENTPSDRHVLLCPTFTSLAAVAQNLPGSRVRLGAQNIHWEDSGAYTGEVSGPMLVELCVSYAIVGHSERRQYFGETDETVNWRLKAAQRHQITPILCVGETKAQRDAGQTEAVVSAQLERALAGIEPQNLVVAYEPIWAIGTGDTCEAAEANRVIGLIRAQLPDQDVTIQYGGSVKPSNVDEIMAQPEINGALVGGASLAPQDFARLVNYQ
ncbi:MAG: triose-phosphate isomerase [Spirulinaceae cyanobacterium RM2_2_10]|nr:triose-phosphate isomerase [Spirulinaceae cyanobacterium SM2_1_0]NJO20509.1 triose-phosphate isomerase [Spirulinaceae cyanobacterium RM2_2_10]